MHLLYFTAEQWPTFRADLVALFGKYLPRHNVTCDIVTERELSSQGRSDVPWGGGRVIACSVPSNRAAQYLLKFIHNVRTLLAMDVRQYDAIQVRDMSVTALFALMAARFKKIRFFYWLSYPQSEGQIDRAKNRGFKAGIRFWFPLLQGIIGKWLLYHVVLPRADHIFVQSQQMQLDVAKHGIPMSRMTPVPMGVDTELARPEDILPAQDSRLTGKRVVVYLGTLDRVRQIEVLFQMLAIVKQQLPNILLVLVGDTEDSSHREWLKKQASDNGVENEALWTGWLSSEKAWSYVRAAEIGLSPIPRGYLLDMGSPTKAVEYMALGLPVVVNDNPDQAQVIAESGGGLCVPFQAQAFADGVMQLLSAPEMMVDMGEKGRNYVARVRGYDNISSSVAQVYFLEK